MDPLAVAAGKNDNAISSVVSSLVSGAGPRAQVRPPPEDGGDEEEEVDGVGGNADNTHGLDHIRQQVREVHRARVGQHCQEYLWRNREKESVQGPDLSIVNSKKILFLLSASV